MARCLIAPLVLLAVACIVGGIAIPYACISYSQRFAQTAVELAGKDHPVVMPPEREQAIRLSLERSHDLGEAIALASATFGLIAGGALIYASHLLTRAVELRQQLSDMTANLESEISAKYARTTESEPAGAEQPATRPVDEPEGGEKPQPGAEAHPLEGGDFDVRR